METRTIVEAERGEYEEGFNRIDCICGRSFPGINAPASRITRIRNYVYRGSIAFPSFPEPGNPPLRATGASRVRRVLPVSFNRESVFPLSLYFLILFSLGAGPSDGADATERRVRSLKPDIALRDSALGRISVRLVLRRSTVLCVSR